MTNQPTEYEQVTYNSPGGAQMGKSSTETIAFYGATPIKQPTFTTTQTTVTTTLATSTNPFGCTTSTQLNDIVTELNAAQTDIRALRSALSSMGLLPAG